MNWETEPTAPWSEPAAGTRPAEQPPQPPAAPAPAPMPTRPKGRLLIGGMLMLVCAAAAFAVWDTFARTGVYGIVDGRVIHVSPEWSGVVESTHVREGDIVRQGQLLMTVRSVELQNELARVGDQLKMAQAQLDAQLAQLRWQAEQRNDRSQLAAGEYFQIWSELADARGDLKEKAALRQRLETANRTMAGSVGAHQLEAAQIGADAADEKIKRLSDALEEYKQRTQAYRQSEQGAQLQFQPQLVHVETLQAEWERLRDLLDRAELRSPCNGRIAKVLRFSGEYAPKGGALVEVVEHGSLEAVVYIPQEHSERIRIGDRIAVRVTPERHHVPCEVVSLGTQLKQAPAPISRYYYQNEHLLPVRLRPLPGIPHLESWRQGSRIRIPWDSIGVPLESAPVQTRKVSA